MRVDSVIWCTVGSMHAHGLVAGVRALIAPGGRSLRLREFVGAYRVVTTSHGYNRAMVFEWREAKNQANIRKLGVSLQTAQWIFGGPF